MKIENEKGVNINSERNIIFIQGGSHTDVQKALQQWIDSYAAQLNPDFVFKLYKNGPGKHVIQVDERLDNMLFYFLVNYINYPTDINYKVITEGFTIGKDKNSLNGKQLLVFISEFDTEYDNVMIVTEENSCYKMDFAGKISKSTEARIYRKPPFTASGSLLVLNAKEIKKTAKDVLEDENRINKRFLWITICVIAAHTLNFQFVRFYSMNKEFSFGNISAFLFWGLFVWLYLDYKILRNKNRYGISFMLSFAVLIYVYILFETGMFKFSKFTLATATSPLILLLIQWPTRLLFVFFLKREPEVESSSNFADKIYSLLLFLGTIICSLLIVS